MASVAKNTRSNGSSRKSPRRTKSVAFALCVRKGPDCRDLRLATLYPLVSDPDARREGYLRVVDESGEDYLYPAQYFVRRRLLVKLARLLTQRAHDSSILDSAEESKRRHSAGKSSRRSSR